MTPELKDIAQRLEEVEKQIAHLAVLTVEQSDRERTVFARRFVLVDEKGQRRATLDSTPAGPCLALFDTDEKPRACMGVTDMGTPRDEGAWLQLCNSKGQSVAEVREYEDGPRVALFDTNGDTRITLKVSEEGSFAFLFGPNGKQHLRLELHSSGQASLVMQDSNGDPRLMLAAESDKGPVIAFFKDSEVFWRVP